MQIFRRPQRADSTGDAIPFYHEGVYHIFSLTPPPGTTVYPARLRTSWSHHTSRDLVHWQEEETALWPGEGDAPDACGVWTGAVIFGEGLYHIFYTGYNYTIEDQQTICHASSTDGIHWTKDPENPVIKPVEGYERLDWRDPFVFYNEEEGLYWLILSARRAEGPPTKRGCVVLFRSPDLKDWAFYGPIYLPYHTNCPECAEIYKMGDKWFLSYSKFSEYVDTIYRTADSPYGPWQTPRKDGIGGRRFYAAKSLLDAEGRRFYFGWAHDRAEGSDTGEWYWGGAFCIPHEVCLDGENELAVKLPQEYREAFARCIPCTFKPIWGPCSSASTEGIELDAAATLSYGFLTPLPRRFRMSCSIRVLEAHDYFGLILKSDEQAARCLELRIEPRMQRVSLVNLPMDVDPFWRQSCTNMGEPKQPGPDGTRVCEKVFDCAPGDRIRLDLIVDEDLIELFIDDRVAFTYRFYEKMEYELGYIAQDSHILVEDTALFSLDGAEA